MAALDALREKAAGAVKPSKVVLDRIKRGTDRMRQDSSDVNLCVRFWRGDQYTFVNKDRYLVKQSTVLDGESKPRHRMRTVHNLLIDPVEHEVSSATQRVPGYQVVPTKVDQDTIDAAKMAEKVARYGYDAWDVRRARERIVTSSVVEGEGFAYPYWNDQLGVPISDEASVGDVRIKVYGRNEVVWEPSIDFTESRWHAVIQARPIDELQEHPNFLGGQLDSDASAADVVNEGAKKGDQSNLVMVTDYFERPSRKEPQGRRLCIANGRLIFPAESYPCVDGEGKTVDEPVLHYLPRIIDPESDRAMGLVQHCIDPQRTHNDVWNKQLEWKNLSLVPQILAPVGSIRTRRTDEPGAIIEYIPVGGQVPQWQQVPAMPGELESLKQATADEVRRLFATSDIPNQVDSGRGVQALLDRDENRRAGFIARLAEFDGRLMRHCVYLVQRYYTEPRLLQIRGKFGPENLAGFTGADLRGQADIQVLPQSIEPRTKEGMAQQLQNLLQLFPGAFDPQKVIVALQAGQPELLIESYELEVAKVHRLIQRLLTGPDALFAGQPVDPATMDPANPQTQPDWMPKPYDNVPIQKAEFENFLKTAEFEGLDPGMKEAANLIYQGFEQIEAQQQAQQAQAQADLAAQMGAQNATKAPDQGGKPLPSLPSVQQ